MSAEQVAADAVLRAASRRRRPLQAVLRFMRKKPLGAAGAFIVLLLIAMAFLAPVAAPYDPLKMDYSHRFAAPGAQFYLGTDNFGRDIFSRIAFGARISLYVSIFAVASGTTVGALLGLTSGYLSGRFDFFVQRLVDIKQAFPSLILALTVMAALGQSLNNVVIAIAITLIPGSARIVRSTALSVRETEYVQAARAIGCGTWRVMFLHVMPNCIAPFIIIATAAMGGAILAEASLSFLGLGVPPPHPSWGGMLSAEGRQYIEKAPWIGIFPGIAISLVVYGFNLLGDSLRDVLDPRLRR